MGLWKALHVDGWLSLEVVIAERKNKTDKLDAQTLAEFLALDQIPESWPADAAGSRVVQDGLAGAAGYPSVLIALDNWGVAVFFRRVPGPASEAMGSRCGGEPILR